jgi:hypothetical protein
MNELKLTFFHKDCKYLVLKYQVQLNTHNYELYGQM